MTTTTGARRRKKGAGKAADEDAGLRSAQHSEAGAAKPKDGDGAARREAPKPGEAVTPSLADGFNGASDASILERYAELITTPEQLAQGIVIVQCARWLNRFVGGYWYHGGSHVARLNYGPGIAFTKYRNDRADDYDALPCNLSAGGVA